MNTQTITDIIDTLPKRHCFLSIVYDLRDIFKEKAEKLSVYNTGTAIQEIDILIDLLGNLRTLVRAAEASEKLHATLTPTKQ